MSRLRSFWLAGHADAEVPLRAWFRVADQANWEKFADVRRDFPRADAVGDRIVFDVGGNRYRLVVRIDYVRKGVLIRWVGTHAEYDRVDIASL